MRSPLIKVDIIVYAVISAILLIFTALCSFYVWMMIDSPAPVAYVVGLFAVMAFLVIGIIYFLVSLTDSIKEYYNVEDQPDEPFDPNNDYP